MYGTYNIEPYVGAYGLTHFRQLIISLERVTKYIGRNSERTLLGIVPQAP